MPTSHAVSATSSAQEAVQGGTPCFESRAAALSKARELSERIRARAKQTEADRCVPQASIDELSKAGLFHLITPRVFGGSELGLAALVEVTAELASACGSTGWVYGVLAGHSWLLNLFPVETQREILADPHALIATVFRLGGKVTPVDGGYRLTGGEGRFCSGIDHAQWVIVGNAVTRADGTQEPRFFVVPRSAVEIIDDWFTAGMRGTGSRSIRIAETFIPELRSVKTQDMLTGSSAGGKYHEAPLYRMPFQDISPFSLVGAPLGMARAAIRAFAVGLGQSVTKLPDEQVAAQSATFARLGKAATDVDAAYALILEDAIRIDHADRPEALTPLDRARLPRDWAYAAQVARNAVNALFEASGGSGIYDSSELQRIWRDINSAAQHFAFTWDSAMSNFGRVILGLKPTQAGPRSGR